jgi:fermentation-respiration switch protein FrsA (DUF1100 family)
LLFSHGNAEDVGVNKAFCEWLSEQLGVDIVTYDYSGYGMGTGEPSEKNLYADCTAVYKWMKSTLKLRTDQIILYGKSLGTAPTVDLATRFASIGVILVCPLASGARVVFPKVKNSLLDRVFCPTILKIDKVTTPIFIMHGTNDEVINVCNGQDLYDACRPQHPLPPVWVEGTSPIFNFSLSYIFLMSVLRDTMKSIQVLVTMISSRGITVFSSKVILAISFLSYSVAESVLIIRISGVRMFLDHCAEIRQLRPQP